VELRYTKNRLANTKLDYTHDCAAEHVPERMRMESESMLGETGRGPKVNRAKV